MTEERIKELAKFTVDNIVGWSLPEQGRRITGLIRTVAAEARRQGIDEMQEVLPKDLYWYEGGEIVMPVDKAERLKEKGE